MFMMGLGLAQIGLAWFGLRHGLSWAFWALVITNVSYVPYFAAIASTFSNFGVPFSIGDYFFYAVFPLPVIPAIALGWLGRPPGGITSRPATTMA